MPGTIILITRPPWRRKVHHVAKPRGPGQGLIAAPGGDLECRRKQQMPILHVG